MRTLSTGRVEYNVKIQLIALLRGTASDTVLNRII
jgi:hypothetical protein